MLAIEEVVGPPSDNFIFGVGFLEFETGISRRADEGTITISGTSPNFIVTFKELVFNNDLVLSGNYIGSFEVGEPIN